MINDIIQNVIFPTIIGTVLLGALIILIVNWPILPFLFAAGLGAWGLGLIVLTLIRG